MNAGGILLVIAGIWVIAQVTSGKALDRLGITHPAEPVPEPHTPRDPRYGGPQDARGRPL